MQPHVAPTTATQERLACPQLEDERASLTACHRRHVVHTLAEDKGVTDGRGV